MAVTALSAVWLLARKSALIASLLSATPAWLKLDPLPILATDDDVEEDGVENAVERTDQAEESDSVESLFSIEQMKANQAKREVM
ncbi:MAG: hypothetical protein ACRYGK_01560 [Janthinobacterium lividum]